MLTQKITFTPVDNYKLTNKARSKKASQISVSTPEYSSIDYSKIAFGAMYGVKPKKINLDAEKSKLLRQITELLQTEEQDVDAAEMTMKVMRRVMNFFRESLKKYEKILKEAELLSENKALNSQQKLEEIQKLQKRLSQASKFKYNTDGPKNKKQVAENVDYLLLNRLKSAVVEDDFNLQKVLTDYYSGLKNISKIEDLNKQYPKIKTPTSPKEVIAKKIESVLNRDFYEGLGEHMGSLKEASEYCLKPISGLVYDIAQKYKVDPIPLFKAVFPHTTAKIFERYGSIATSGMSSIPEVRKIKTPQVSHLDLKLLSIDFDDFVTSTVRKHYFEGQKLNEVIYEKDGVINLNVKVDPQWRDFWRQTYKSVVAGYHQNKEHWNTIILDGTIPDKDVKQMIAESYDIITDSPTKRIYEAVKTIPKGKVATYGKVAELAGNPRMSRAVGNALHHNPDPKHIPCYRVVNSKGELAGAFAFGGEHVQEELLKADGIEVVNGRVDLKKYGI